MDLAIKQKSKDSPHKYFERPSRPNHLPYKTYTGVVLLYMWASPEVYMLQTFMLASQSRVMHTFFFNFCLPMISLTEGQIHLCKHLWSDNQKWLLKTYMWLEWNNSHQHTRFFFSPCGKQTPHPESARGFARTTLKSQEARRPIYQEYFICCFVSYPDVLISAGQSLCRR